MPTPEESVDVALCSCGSGVGPPEEWLREWSVLELRRAADSRARRRAREAERPGRGSAYWVRVRERLPDDVLVHQAALTYVSDMTLLGAALVLHGVHVGDPRVQAASLDHTVWFHRPFRADEWLLYDQTSPRPRVPVGSPSASSSPRTARSSPRWRRRG